MVNYFVILNVVTLFLVSYTLSDSSSITAFGQNNKLIFTPSDNPYNKTFAKWANDWWDYHLGIKDIKNNPAYPTPGIVILLKSVLGTRMAVLFGFCQMEKIGPI